MGKVSAKASSEERTFVINFVDNLGKTWFMLCINLGNLTTNYVSSGAQKKSLLRLVFTHW
jgi:hypothetical protein